MSEVNPTVTYHMIQGFPGYRVGDDGSVWSRIQVRGNQKTGKVATLGDTWKRLATTLNGNGRVTVCLSKTPEKGRKTFHAHTLVLEAFVGPCPEGKEGCHFPDRNPANNRLSNLRWDTCKANQADRVIHGTDPKGERHPRSKLTEADIIKIRGFRKSGYTYRRIGKIFGVTKMTIADIVKGRRWKHVPLQDE